MSSVPLRRRLFLLAAVGIVPVAIVAALGLSAFVLQQESQREQVGLELARAVAIAVDAQIRGVQSVLASLGTDLEDDARHLQEFELRARGVLSSQPSWIAVTLSDAAGRRLVDTRSGYVEKVPMVEERESFDRVMQRAMPTVSSLSATGTTGPAFRVRVPVVRDGRVGFAITAVVAPAEVHSVLERLAVPDDWVISVFDRSGRRIARSRAHDQNLGGVASPSLQALMGQGKREGFGVTTSLEGDRNYSAYSYLPDGWSVALGFSVTRTEAALRRSILVLGGGTLISLLLGIVAAALVGRSITRPIERLRASAMALGRGEPLAHAETPIQEIEDVATALVDASRERAAGEAEREVLLRKEREARETAESAGRAKDEFLATLSHELRTPLNAVYGWARLLQERQITGADADRGLDAIVRNAQMQVQLIDDLLDVSRIVTGKIRLDVQAVDVGEVTMRAMDAVKPAADARAIRVQTVIDPRAGAVMGDPARLQQVVWNLLMNAVKFTPKNGRIQVVVKRVNSHVEVVVSDTGRGITGDLLPFIFDRFRQSDSSSTRAHGGLGIGLALAKHLVELHGGTITATSDGEGQGATFVVTLPVSILGGDSGRHARPQVHGPATNTQPAIRLDGLRVLVVDDDVEALNLARTVLGGAGAIVEARSSVADALGAFDAARPDVVVSDIEMPGEDGYALIAKIRARDSGTGRRIPAVALTAYGRVQDQTRSLAAGYNVHVAKPVDPAELIAIIASLTSGH